LIRSLETTNAIRGRALIIGAAVLWSTGGTAVKLAHATAPQIAMGRAVVAAAVLFALFRGARAKWNRHVVLTALFYAVTCTLYVFANTLTTAGNTIFIQNTAPIWVLLLGPIVLKEKSTLAEKLSVPISIAGCLLFFLDDMSAGRFAGNLCAAAASITYAILIVGYRKVSTDEGLSATVLGNVFIALALAWPSFRAPMPSVESFVVFAYLGAIQQAIAAVLFVRGIRAVSAMEGALLTLFEPLLSPIWAFLFVGESLGPLALIGAALILAAMIWRVVASSRATA
jgi:drug/metabolite transporter (DMT)-like permease